MARIENSPLRAGDIGSAAVSEVLHGGFDVVKSVRDTVPVTSFGPGQVGRLSDGKVADDVAGAER